MGMGEPLLNYDAVLKSIRIVNHEAGKNIGIRHITVSTCGIVPGIVRLAKEDIHPRLAISLSARPTPCVTSSCRSTASIRSRSCSMPSAAYQEKTGQRVTFEYVMIDKINDSITHARLLVKLLKGVSCNVNLIEHNPYTGCDFAGSSRDQIAALRRRPQGRRRRNHDPLPPGPRHPGRLRPAPGRLREVLTLMVGVAAASARLPRAAVNY